MTADDTPPAPEVRAPTEAPARLGVSQSETGHRAVSKATRVHDLVEDIDRIAAKLEGPLPGAGTARPRHTPPAEARPELLPKDAGIRRLRVSSRGEELPPVADLRHLRIVASSVMPASAPTVELLSTIPASALDSLGAIPGPALRAADVHPTDGSTARAARRTRVRPRTRILNLVTAGLLGFATAICAIVIAVALTGHHLETVVTGSMQPQIPVGSLIAGERVEAEQLQVGDILMFPRPGNPQETIVHRVVQIHLNNGYVQIQTKGDANQYPDCFVPNSCLLQDAQHTLVDRVLRIYPVLGDLALKARLAAIILLPAVGIGWVVVWGIREVRRTLA